ncbi:hypothetical protein P255_02472 [Acinetobacter brisouii CIP 110357]|uniref:Uncharacterized protein n=1 Tax=Acinetobacter brisouii CIP 110357 TaxID=1341683 RepID=V2UPA7_9GAMM|nr:hypothetical protein [Acinetobacter brisouii]ENV47188.1 hypothetical protein F954_01989 [Acinetobacter brisouii ANC 4119]ESK50490.1 hypothetical protein P255_02472 [Acinetobacter brisouii CIP 110357]KJV39786.1 hypothetical protein VH98_04710 [Acinetobacter brisouii]
MTRDELIKLLKQMGIHHSSYSFDKIKNSECISVLKQKTEWCVYYTERDKPELIFSSKEESNAYRFVANQFERWISN